MNTEVLTLEQIAQHYSAAMDSVNLINSLVASKPGNMTEATRIECIARNQEHLVIMLAKPFWTAENLVPMQTASVAVVAVL